MDCFHPLDAYRPPGERQFKIGLRPSPLYEAAILPCGKCLACDLTRAGAWGLRAMSEQRYHERSCMLNPTYSDQHFPESPEQFRRDHVLFIKRLRAAHDVPLRFFGGLELGARNYRPHSHILQFGADYLDDAEPVARGPSGEPLFRSARLDALWGKGRILVGTLTERSAHYVGRYCVKKADQPDTVKLTHPMTGEVLDWPTRYRPIYPVNPPLGGQFVSEFIDDVFNGLRARGGARLATPRAWLRIMEKLDPARYEVLMDDRKRLAAEHRDPDARLPQRQEARETVLRARLGAKLERL